MARRTSALCSLLALMSAKQVMYSYWSSFIRDSSTWRWYSMLLTSEVAALGFIGELTSRLLRTLADIVG